MHQIIYKSFPAFYRLSCASGEWEMNEQKQALIGAILLLTLAMLPITYVLLTKNSDDYISYSLILGLIFVSLIILAECNQGVKKALEDEWLVNFILFKAIFLIPVSGFFYYSLLIGLYDLSLFFYKHTNDNLTIVAPAVLALAVGMALYKFRSKQRVLYGISEVLVGIAVTVSRVQTSFSTEHQNNVDLYIAVLTAGVYLIVRGLDNIEVGLKSKTDSKFFKWLL